MIYFYAENPPPQNQFTYLLLGELVSIEHNYFSFLG